MYRLFGFCVLCLSVPYMTHGAVLINEIAWMGTSVGPNEEWVELYNNGNESVSLDGWQLSDNVSLNISLAGTVGAGEYVLLERTDDTTVPSVPMLLSYTGALSNEGRTLTLYRADDSIEDQIAGGDGWTSIGGDNVTKDTPQRTLNGWVTQAPTPGEANEETSSSNESTNTQSSVSQSSAVKISTKASEKKATLDTEDEVLELTLKAPAYAYANQVVNFEVVPTGAGKTILNSLSYAWNFGDTYTSSVQKPKHAFAYPGEYVVVVHASFAKKTAEIRHEITILPVSLSIDKSAQGDVLIHNKFPYEVDIGEYQIHGETYFVFPLHTILKPKGTLTIAADRVNAKVDTPISLYDGERRLLSSTVGVETTLAESKPYLSETIYTDILAPENVREVDEVSLPELPEQTEIITIGSQDPDVAGVVPDYTKRKVYALGIVVCIGAILTVYLRRREG